MKSRSLVLLLLVSAVLAGIVAALIVRSLGGPSGQRVLDSYLAVGFPAMSLALALWELRKRRQGKRTGIGRTWWERDRDDTPSPGRFLAVSLVQVWFVPLDLGLVAALRLGGMWILAPLSITSITALALSANYHVEQ